MAATLWKIYDFFVRVPDGRDEKPDSEKSIDVRVPCGRDEKPYSEKSVDLRVPSGRGSQKSVDLRVASGRGEKTGSEKCVGVRVSCGRGEKPDSEKSVDVRSKERFMSNSFLPLKYKLKAVKVYTRHAGQEVFWDKKLGRHRTFKELQKDPEIRREIKEYIICRGLEQFGMNLEKLLGFVGDKELNFRINAESCWDSLELEHPATLEELGMDPENKGIISDFLRFVRDKELCKSDWMNEKLISWLVYDSPSTNRSRIIAAMANYLKFDVYHLDLTSFSSFDELEYTLLSTRNRSVIAIEGLYQCAGMLLNRKTDEFAVKHLLNEIDALFLRHNNERIFVFTTNHRDQEVAASLHPVGMDIYIHTSLPQPIALPDGGERTLHNSLLVSNSEKENTREAYDSTKRYSLLNFDATENKEVKVYSRQGRDCSHPMELEQPPTLAELGKDPENEGIISDLLSFVRDKELYKRIGKKWKRGYLLHDSPGTDRSSLIAAMANYLELDIYDLDLTALSSIWELQNVLLRNRNRSLIAIKDFNHWFGMHPNLKNEVLSLRKEKELTLSSLLEIIDGLVSCCWDQQIIVLTTNHNQRDRFHTALLHPLNINAYMHTSSPQPLVFPNGGEIAEFDSSEQKTLADFDATNKKAYQSGVLVFRSEKENTREASKGQCMTESALSLVDSTTRISSTDFNAPNYKADLVRTYQRDPFTLNLEKKDMTEGLSGECLSNSVLRDDDSTKRNSLPDCASLAPFSETIEDFDDFDYGAGMLPNLKDECVDGLFSSCGDEQIIVCSTNHRERDDAALPPLVDMDTCIHTASPQPIALPDGWEIVQLDSSEQKPLEDFDATSNRVYQSDVVVSNLEGANTRKVSRRQCMPESVLSLVDSTTKISSKNFDAPNSSAYLEREYQSGPIVFNSKKKDSGGGLNRECLTKSVLSLEDSSRQKLLLDVDAAKNKAHLDRAYQEGLVVSLSENKNRGEALKRECVTKSILCSEDLQQHFGGSRDAAEKNFGGIHTTDSLARKSLKVVETLPTWEQPNDSVPLLSIERLTLEGWVQEEKSPNLPRVLQNIVEERVKKMPICSEGLTSESASASRWPISLPDGRHIVMLHPSEQSTKNVAHAARVDQCSPTKSLSENKMVRKTLKRKCRTMSVTKIHQPYFGRRCEGSAKNFCATHIVRKHVTNRVSTVKRIHKHRIHQWPFRQKWATRKGYSTGDKTSFEVSSLSMSQCAEADENGPTVSNSEKGIMREALKRNSLKDLRQHFGARGKDEVKGLCDSLTWKSFEVLDSLPLGEQSNNVRNLDWWRTLTHKRCVPPKKSQDLPRSQLYDCSGELAAQSAIGLLDGGHIPSLSENKSVRKTLKRKCRPMCVLSLEDHQQHVGRRWEDDANFLGAKRICWSIDCKSTEKCIRRRQGTRRCQFKQSAVGLPDGGCMLSLSKKKIVRETLKRKCRTMSVLSLEYHQHVDNRWEDAVKSLGSIGAHAAKRVCRQLVIHHVSSANCIHGQSGIHRWPFQQNWAAMKGYHLVDERLVEVISLCGWETCFEASTPSALPGGGEFVGPIALSSSEFTPTNNRTHHVGQDQSGATASRSKKKRTREQEDREEINNIITLNDLRKHYGRKRKDAAESLGVSVSTLKRISRLHGITRWPNSIRQKVLKPPDPHGETNPSTTCEKLSTNGQIEMENDPALSQPMPTIPHTMGSSYDWRSLLVSQEEPFMEGHVCGSSNWAAASCYDPTLSQPLPTMPHAVGSLNDWRNLLASQEKPFLEGDVYGNINSSVASCFDPTPIQPLPTSLQTMGTSEDWSIFLPSQEEPCIEGHVFESINWTVPPCSDLDPSQPMSTTPYTMPTIPLMTPTTFMKLKAIYGDTTIKFQLPLTSGINELKEEVSKILEFEHGSFNVEYKDEDGDWILMARDENVREYLQLLTSLGNQAGKLKIRDKVPNNTNFCETCGTLKHKRP